MRPMVFGGPGGHVEIDVGAENRFRRVDLRRSQRRSPCPEDGLDDVGNRLEVPIEKTMSKSLAKAAQTGDPGFRQCFAEKDDGWSDR